MRSLRIFLAMGSRAAGVAGSSLYCDNIHSTLRNQGHTVVLYNFEEELRKAGKELGKAQDYCSEDIIRTFLECHRQRGFDLAFTMLNSEVVRPEALKTLSSLVPTVNYTTNYHQFYLVRDIAKHVTLSTYISLPAKEAFDSLGVKSYWMPMAANPELYRPAQEKTRFASFVGTAYGDRPYCLWRLLQLGIDLNVYGPGWKPRSSGSRWLRNWVEPLIYMVGPTTRRLQFISRNERRLIVEKMNEDHGVRMHAPLSDREMFRLLAMSHVVINIAESRFNHDYLNPNLLRGCNFRDFEVPMSRTCLVTQRSDELAHFYEPGKEVIEFVDEVDLAEKLRYCEQHLEQVQRIAEAGYRRALAEHTWEHRFAALFRHLGL